MDKKLRIHYLQHVSFENLGSMQAYLQKQGHSLSATHLYRSDPLPEIDQIDWLIVMGGPMGVHDEEQYPWLAAEKAFIRKAIENGKTVLGICLGAQLIADVLGASVTKNRQREIGWFSIIPSEQAAGTMLGSVFQRPLEVFHWHGDTFALPDGAIPLASSEACQNQGFILGERVIAFQFHLETTPASAQALVENCRDELDGSAYVQSEAEILAAQPRFEAINQVMQSVLQKLEQVTCG
jgi:GMP synthase-like glutamine amidotransferase